MTAAPAVRHMWRLEPWHTGPQGIQVLQTCHGLARAGARVRLAFDGSRGDRATDVLAACALDRPAGLTLEMLPRPRPLASLAYRGGILRDALGDAWLLERHPRHADELLAALGARPGRRRRVVVEWHGLPEDGDGAGWARAERIWARAGGHVLICAALRDAVLDALGSSRAPALVLPNGAPSLPPPGASVPGLLRCATLLRKPEEAALLARIAAALPPPWRLEVVGPARDGALGAARALGRRTPSEARALLAEAEAVLCPFADTPQRRRFDSPLKLWEALAVGRPVLATAVPPVVEAVGADGDCVIHLPPERPEAVGAALARLRADPTGATAMAARGRALAASWTWEARGRALLAFLAELEAR